MSNRGQIGAWLFVIFLLLILSVVLLVVFLKGSDSPPPPVVQNVSNVTYYNISIVLNNVAGGVPILYTLSNITKDVRGGFDEKTSSCGYVANLYAQGYVLESNDAMSCPIVSKWIMGGVLVNGQVFPENPEFYKAGIVANSTVFLEGFSNSYYYNSTICNVTREMFPCRLSLNPKANDYSLEFTKDLLTINVSGGVIQRPIICFAYNYQLSNILIDLPSVDVPDDLHWKVDQCFNVTRDLSNTASFPLEFHDNPFFVTILNVSVLVRDQELSPYKNIGDRTAEIS